MPFPAVHPALDRALAARGYAEPTPVQLAVVEADQNAERPNADMLVSAQTGSGKTVAFGLAFASTLLGGNERFAPPSQQPLALIIAPTRELAMQISREFEWLYADTNARIIQCVGGMSVRAEQQQLSRGAHIVIGTPGRLCDHLAKGYLDLSTLKVAVLDEADEMLDLGFREELEQLLDATPADSRRTLLFSATIARGIAMLAKNYQRDSIRIDTTSATEPHGDIDYRAMRVSPGDTERAVVNVLRYFEAGAALVFCATREAVRHLHASLRERGFHAVGLSGEMNQRERNDALQSLRDGHAKVCVATDVAARGLDLPDLGLVIHADLPTNKETLLHRSGRTGRAGKKGASVLLVTHTKRRRTEQILASANINATWSGPPTAREIREQDRQRLLTHPALAAAVTEEDHSVAKQLAETIPAEQLAAALIALLRNELPEPEDVSDDGRMRNAQTFERQSGHTGERTFREPSERPAPRGRAERGFTASEGDGVWFRLNVGRQRNADPKWILPLICRLGHVTKAEIGPIRIFTDETKFEIVGHAAEAFSIAVRDTQDDQIHIEPTTAPGPNDNTHPMRARRDGDGPRADRAPREDRPKHGEDRPPRPKREYGDRPQREPRGEPRADARPPREDFKRSARDEARAARHQQRDVEQAKLAADPVYASLTPSEPTPPPAQPKGPPHVHPSGLNRRERRDAARAAGKLPPMSTEASEAPKRSWSPETASRPLRADKPHADVRHAERRQRTDGDKPPSPRPEGFKPRGPKPPGKFFKPRGDKPFAARGGKPGGKPFRGKPAGNRDRRG